MQKKSPDAGISQEQVQRTGKELGACLRKGMKRFSDWGGCPRNVLQMVQFAKGL